MSFSFKITLVIFVILIFSISVQTYLTIEREKTRMTNSMINEKILITEMIAKSVESAEVYAIPAHKREIVKEVAKPKDIYYCRIVKPTGEIFISNIKDEVGKVIKDPAVITNKTLIKDDTFKRKSIKVVISPTYRGYTIWLGFSLESVQAAINEMTTANLSLSLLIAITIAILSYIVTNRMIRPIKQLTKGAQIIGKGNLDYRIKVVSKDELGQLAFSFNQMTEDLQKTTVSRDELVKEIDERKRMEELLRENESRLRKILDSVQAGIMLIDTKTHNIVDVNPVTVKIFGLPKEQIIGSICHQFICPAEKGKCPITDLGQSVDNAERLLINANGEKMPILKTVILIMIGDREYLLESFVDITERKKAEEQQRQLMKDLEETNKIMVGRELKMIELKKEVNRLSQELGRQTPYDLSSLERTE